MNYSIITLLLAVLVTAATARAADDDVAVPVPELHTADASLPGADTNAPAPQTKPADPVVSTNLSAKPASPPPAPAGRSFPPDTVFTVQLGAFQTRERAFALYWELSKKLSPLQVTAPSAKDKLYRVRYGSYPNYAEAKAAADKVKARGIECFVAALNQEGENITSSSSQPPQ